MNLYYVSKEILNLGKIKIISPQGKEIFVYNVERCLCDMIRDKNNQDVEIIKYAFQTYVISKNRNFHKLMDYAKKLKIEEEINKYIEILL